MVNMDVKLYLESDLKEAIRARDDLRKRTLRMALSALKNAEIEKRGALDDIELLAILRKEVKTRRESIADAQRAGRNDLITSSEAEITVLEKYFPEPLSLEELETLARQAISEVGATSPQQMGQVMKILVPRVKGRVEGALVSQVVQKLLI